MAIQPVGSAACSAPLQSSTHEPPASLDKMKQSYKSASKKLVEDPDAEAAKKALIRLEEELKKQIADEEQLNFDQNQQSLHELNDLRTQVQATMAAYDLEGQSG